jgi:subtilisin family serine protease
MRKRIRCTAVGVACSLALSLPAVSGEIAPRLEEALRSAGPDERLPVVVMMQRTAVDGDLLARVRKMNRSDRRAHVVSELQNVAEESQAPVLELLATESGETPRVRRLLGINGLALEADPRSIRKLAGLAQVRWVLLDRDGGGHLDGDGPTGGDTSGPNPEATVAPEVVAMGAEDVWNQLGYTGRGVIVAIVDTGVDRTHPDLADHIWTNLGEVADNGLDDDGNGLVDDTWGWDFCHDDNNPNRGQHGTQVAGQVAGDGTNGTVTGMAPDVELMALGIDCDTPSIGWAASDYAITEGADIISQSYSWWWTDQPDYEAFRRQSDAELAAGVIHSNSAGNHGASTGSYPIPYNVSTPGNCPAPWNHPDQLVVGGVSSMIAVGNINWNLDVIEYSSSRGPSAWEDIQANTDPGFPHNNPAEYQDYPYENGAQMGLIKPDISAYGNGTTSTCPGPTYCSFSGTSSAQPHVAGTLALMLEANPEATPGHLAQALLTTAQHRGALGKNNVYGVGLVQALPAVERVESDVLYHSHTIEDIAEGNGDFAVDPGERVTLSVTLGNGTDGAAADRVEAILTTSTPGVEIHNRFGFYPTVPALGTAESMPPHFSFSVDSDSCSKAIAFELELRYGGEVHGTTFEVSVGDPTPVTLLYDDFETDQGWTTDPGTATQGFWVRVDPDLVKDFSQRVTNPEDDTTPDPGTHCWITGNGSPLFDPNANDVDGGTVTLISPQFGSAHLLTLNLHYDLWHFDLSASEADVFKAELSNDGGANWTAVDVSFSDNGGWHSRSADLLAALSPSDEMRVRFTATDDAIDGPVEAGIDELTLEGVIAECDDYMAPAVQPPNAVGDSLRLAAGPGGHVAFSWAAPPIDDGHDAATLYRIRSSSSPQGPFGELGSATATTWVEVDGFEAMGLTYYRVHAENAGGGE